MFLNDPPLEQVARLKDPATLDRANIFAGLGARGIASIDHDPDFIPALFGSGPNPDPSGPARYFAL